MLCPALAWASGRLISQHFRRQAGGISMHWAGFVPDGRVLGLEQQDFAVVYEVLAKVASLDR